MVELKSGQIYGFTVKGMRQEDGFLLIGEHTSDVIKEFPKEILLYGFTYRLFKIESKKDKEFGLIEFALYC